MSALPSVRRVKADLRVATERRIFSTATFGIFILSEGGVAVVVFAVLAALPLFVGGYFVFILPQYMVYGLLAMSLSLLWGFAGIVSFGQAAFFAVGAYAMGLVMPEVLPFNSAYVGMLAAMLVGGLMAGVTGWFLFSAGVRASHFVLITLALSIIAEQIAVSQSELTGGFNGLFVMRMALLPLGGGSSGDIAIYFFILIVVSICYFGLRWLTVARFGKILAGIRENEDRLTALGFQVHWYKTGAFALAGALAALAGALYATDAGFVSPSLASVLFSTQVVVWVAIGGRHSLLGVLIGAIVVAAASNYLSAIIPNYWQLFIGLLFIFVIIFFKGGLAGMLEGLVRRLRPRKTP